MQFFDQIVRLIQTGLDAIFRLIRMVVAYFIAQVSSIPWGNFQSLPYWKQGLLVAALMFAAYYAFKAIRDMLKASEGLLAAFVTVLGAFVRLIVPLLIAALVVLAAVYVVNRVTIPFLP